MILRVIRMPLFVRLLAVASLLVLTGGLRAEQVTYHLTDTVKVNDAELPYELDLELSDESPRRVRFDVLLDLRELQRRFEQLVSTEPMVDVCNGRLSQASINFVADEEALAAKGQLLVELFACERETLRAVDRGEMVYSEVVSLAAAVSLNVKGLCLIFGLEDVEMVLPTGSGDVALNNAHLANAKELLLRASEAFFQAHPICLKLPSELSSLTPREFEGGTREIGKGGVGARLSGSVDVSTRSILDVLNALQDRGIIARRL